MGKNDALKEGGIELFTNNGQEDKNLMHPNQAWQSPLLQEAFSDSNKAHLPRGVANIFRTPQKGWLSLFPNFFEADFPHQLTHWCVLTLLFFGFC